jgi:hypothetical protein
MPTSRKRKSSAAAAAAAGSGAGSGRGTAPKRSRKVGGGAVAAVTRSDTVCDCNALAPAADRMRLHRNFRAACQRYGFPGSHQVGSYGPRGAGIVRTYSNATPGKDIVLNGGRVVLYRLKADVKLRAQFEVNLRLQRSVRVFRKVEAGVLELGEYHVTGFVPAEPGDEFGPTFVKFVRVEPPPAQVVKSEP